MKKCLCLIISLVMLLSIAGCAAPSVEAPTQPTEKAPVLPPTRLGEFGMTVSLVRSYTFETAMEASDAVARIRIGDWLGETRSQTQYEAEVLECFKGELPKTFVLSQFGNSKKTVVSPVYPLFTSGNELFIFLSKVPDDVFEDQNIDYDEIYWSTGTFQTVLDVSYDENGNRYYADWWGDLGKSTGIPTLYKENRELFKQVYNYAMEDDPIRAEIQRSYPYVFAEEDVIALIEQYK